jgi:hypothetical protein
MGVLLRKMLKRLLNNSLIPKRKLYKFPGGTSITIVWRDFYV